MPFLCVTEDPDVACYICYINVISSVRPTEQLHRPQGEPIAEWVLAPVSDAYLFTLIRYIDITVLENDINLPNRSLQQDDHLTVPNPLFAKVNYSTAEPGPCSVKNRLSGPF